MTPEVALAMSFLLGRWEKNEEKGRGRCWPDRGAAGGGWESQVAGAVAGGCWGGRRRKRRRKKKKEKKKKNRKIVFCIIKYILYQE